MNKYLEQLVELVEIDKSIDSFEPRVQEIRAALDGKLDVQNELESKIESHKEEITDIELNRRKNELHLEELNEKLNSLTDKSKAVKTEKEMKALSLEDEIAKEQINFANEEIERLDKSIQTKEQRLKELEALITESDAQQEEELKSVQTSLDALESEKKVAYKTKDKVVGGMDQKIITFYEKIKRWAKNTTVVEVKKQACYGCFMKLSDKVYAGIVKSNDIIPCPHCGRILYYDPASQPQEEESKK